MNRGLDIERRTEGNWLAYTKYNNPQNIPQNFLWKSVYVFVRDFTVCPIADSTVINVIELGKETTVITAQVPLTVASSASPPS